MTRTRYPILYADPPWHYGTQQHNGRTTTGGAETHYPTMTRDQLEALNVADLAADDALLFLWATSPLLDQAVALISAWGFRYVTVAFVWDKGTPNPGAYTLSQVELCLLGKRGRIPQPRGARNVRQFLHSPRTRHSEKPEAIRDRIEAMFPTQKKLELFARRAVPGWDRWGNEVPSTVRVRSRDR